jgi:hypothetical protein
MYVCRSILQKGRRERKKKIPEIGKMRRSGFFLRGGHVGIPFPVNL